MPLYDIMSLWDQLLDLSWQSMMFYVLILTFFWPTFFICLLYLSVAIQYLYCLLGWVCRQQDSFHTAGMLKRIQIWNAVGRLWYGYEVNGMENIPDKGPAMVILFHGTFPIDYSFFLSKFAPTTTKKKCTIYLICHWYLFRLCGLGHFLSQLPLTAGSRDSCSQLLEAGNMLIIAPGGAYEAQFGDGSYEVLWRDRTGFAEVALRTKCPIIPVFTENVNEAFRTPWILRALFKPLYRWIRLPILPMYGGFPVKLRTVVGRPVEYDPDRCTPSALRDICKKEMEKHINANQERPGSVFRALRQRISSRRGNRN